MNRGGRQDGGTHRGTHRAVAGRLARIDSIGVVNAPFGFALGFDPESPGLMARRPRPSGESVLTTGVIVTVGLAGLAITTARRSASARHLAQAEDALLAGAAAAK